MTAVKEIDEIISKIFQHQIDNPRHGLNCACMDEYIRSMRKILDATPPNLAAMEKKHGTLNTWFESNECKAWRRWRYILGSVLSGMDA